MLNSQNLPNPKPATVPYDQFSSERAMYDLKELTVDIGIINSGHSIDVSRDQIIWN